MPPQRLSEDEATALLSRWKADVTLSLTPPMLHRQLHNPAVEVSDLWCEADSQASCDRARRLRGSLEALRLLSCCRGFDPEKNPSFWRKYFMTCGSPATYRLTRGLFSCFHVVCDTNVDPESLANAFWALLTSATTSEELDSTTQQWLEQRVEVCLERTPPPLEVKLCVRKDRVRWSTIKQALCHLDHMMRNDSSVSTGQHVRLLLGETTQLKYLCPDEDAAALIEIIRMPRVVIDELHVRLDNPNADEISSLMGELVRVDTVEHLSFEFECQSHIVAAIFSALPSMSTLSSLQLERHHYHSGQANEEPCQFGSWLAYALTQRKLRGLPLALNCHALSRSTEEIKAACGQKNCLEEIVSSDTAADNSIGFYDLDATAELPHKTLLTSLETDARSPGITMDKSHRVNVIAKHDSKVIVVIPGAGLMATEFKNLRAFESPSQGSEIIMRDRFQVETLICNRQELTQVTEMLELFGVSLTCLALRSCSPIQAELLEKILSLCPELTKLVITDGNIETFEPLLAAYAKRETRIATVIYQTGILRRRSQSDEASGNVIRQFVDALTTPSHPVMEIVQELCFERITIRPDLMRKLVLALSGNTKLTFLRVWLDDCGMSTTMKS